MKQLHCVYCLPLASAYAYGCVFVVQVLFHYHNWKWEMKAWEFCVKKEKKTLMHKFHCILFYWMIELVQLLLLLLPPPLSFCLCSSNRRFTGFGSHLMPHLNLFKQIRSQCLVWKTFTIPCRRHLYLCKYFHIFFSQCYGLITWFGFFASIMHFLRERKKKKICLARGCINNQRQ